MKVETTHLRKGHIIKDLSTGDSKAYFTPNGFNSVNQAKKVSRAIQLSNGGLGCGAVKVGK